MGEVKSPGAGSGECQDEACVGDWKVKTGQCYQCQDWASRCDEPSFRKDCPQTCGLCGPNQQAPPKAAPAAQEEAPAAAAGTCQDDPCIKGWGETGECKKCEDFAADYCGNDREFMESCPRSCKLCTPDAKPQACVDDFKTSSCEEYKDLGWCEASEILPHCKATCGKCTAAMDVAKDPTLNIPDNAPEGQVGPTKTEDEEGTEEQPPHHHPHGSGGGHHQQHHGGAASAHGRHHRGREDYDSDTEEHHGHGRGRGQRNSQEEDDEEEPEAAESREELEPAVEAEPEVRKPLPAAFQPRSAAPPRSPSATSLLAWLLAVAASLAARA